VVLVMLSTLLLLVGVVVEQKLRAVVEQVV
jgi:hypothetical protein